MDLVFRRDVMQGLQKLVLTERCLRKAVEDQWLFQPNRIRHGRPGELVEAVQTDRVKHFGDLAAAGAEMSTRKRIARTKKISIYIGEGVLAHGAHRRSTISSPLSVSRFLGFKVKVESSSNAAGGAVFVSSRG